MDKVDKGILMQLQRDCKQNTKEIATKVGLSVTPTYERIKKLEQQGLVKNYVALLDKTKVGMQVIAYCQISLVKHAKQTIVAFTSQVIQLTEVMECHHVSGNFDFLLKVAVKDITQFQEFVNEKLSAVEGISTIQSSFVTKTLKESTAFVLK